MPEGPSIVILKELVQHLQLEGKEVTAVSGNAKDIDPERILHQKIRDFRSWGKHFLLCFDDFTIRIHLLMFGTYRINERKDAAPRLSLGFGRDELNFYTCSVKILEGKASELYDWSGDVLSDKWDEKSALKKLKSKPALLVCDALLDQDIFAGVGNIIKNEVLYRIGVHPLNRIQDLPAEKLKLMIKEARNYSFDFLEWKKENTLKAHWLIHTRSTCPKNHPVVKKYLGKTNRRTFYCEQCQEQYSNEPVTG